MSDVPLKGESADYCLECAEKHLQTARILLREALQRAEQCLAESQCETCCTSKPQVLEKIRDAVAELTGCEDDTNTKLDEPRIREINRRTREIRRLIWEKKLAFGKGTLNDIKEIMMQIEELANYIYEQPEVSQKYEELIQEIVEETPPPETEQPIRKHRKNVSEITDEMEKAYRLNLLLNLVEAYME